MKHINYKYFQPNKLDLKDDYSDCSIRAICKVLEIDWREAFDKVIPLCREKCILPSMLFYTEQSADTCKALGLTYNKITNKKGVKRPTVASFARSHKTGRYIVTTAHHVVAVVDGYYFDTWDSGEKSLYSYYEVE